MTPRTSRSSVMRLNARAFLFALAGVIAAEAAVTHALSIAVPDLSETMHLVLDALLLGMAASPFIWFALVRPLQDHSAQLSEARDEVLTRFDQLVEQMSSGVAVYETRDGGSEFVIKEFNNAAERITGIKRASVFGRPALEAFPALDEMGLIDVIRRVWESGNAMFHPTTMYEDGRVSFWAENHVYKLASGEIVAVFDDVTERERALEALRVSEDKYRQVVENAQEAIFVAQDGFIKFPNRRAEELSGYSKEELVVTQFVEFIEPEDRESVLDRHRRRCEGEELPSPYSIRVVTKGGETVWAQINSVAIQWEGRPATLNFLRDVTEQRQLESRYLQSQKMEAVGHLAAGVAHDFNNLLTVISGNASLLKQDLPEEELSSELVDEISSAGRSAASLTRQLLAFSRKQVLRPEVVDVNHLMADLSKMLRRLLGEDIDLLMAPGAGVGKVLVDPGQLEQAIVNLAVNARDAMPLGGKLTVTTDNVELGESYVREHAGSKTGEFVVVTVSDTGVGIDKDKQSLVYEPFYTTKETGKGTGLGLARRTVSSSRAVATSSCTVNRTWVRRSRSTCLESTGMTRLL